MKFELEIHPFMNNLSILNKNKPGCPYLNFIRQLQKHLNKFSYTQVLHINNTYRNMKKPQDSDIFGTKSTTFAPRIKNQSYIDPNAGFQARMDAQYDAYTRKIGSSHRGIFDEKVQPTKVNQQANFDEYYHRFRKDADLQSTIFYEPTLPNSRVIQRPKITERHVPKHAYNQEQVQSNYGKRQTLHREVQKMPENTTQFKGNSSNIFGYDEHADRNGVKNKINKLIPHQMQWTDHDSIKHQDHLIGSSAKSEKSQGLSNISESRSELFNKDQVMKRMEELNIQSQKSKENNSNAVNMMKKKPVPTNPEQKSKLIKKQTVKQLKPETKQPIDSNKVQISILKGWSSNIMEDLSKYCRINGTKIMSINFEQGGKGTLTLDRSKRWENVTDWLRKDAKLKIRVIS